MFLTLDLTCFGWRRASLRIRRERMISKMIEIEQPQPEGSLQVMKEFGIDLVSNTLAKRAKRTRFMAEIAGCSYVRSIHPSID